jgi:enoyl-CoA hydratase
MFDENIILRDEVDERGILSLRLNRPAVLNALNPDLLQSIIIEMERLNVEHPRRTKVVVLSGSDERAFVAGADVRAMKDLGPRAIADYVNLGQRALRSIERLRVPVVAAISGYALGGGLELALACDVIVGDASTKVGLPEVSLGIIPGFGGTVRLARRIGIGRAKIVALSGRVFTGKEAFELGVLDRYIPEGEGNSYSGAMQIAEEIGGRAPISVSHVKELLNLANGESDGAALVREVEAFLEVFNSADRDEGITAFLQKRTPAFKSR